MTVRELREALNKYPDNMEVLVKRVGSVMIELEGDVGYVRSVKESKYTMFGIDFPCVLLTDDDLPCALLTDESDKGRRKRMKTNIYEELRNSMTVQDAARVLKETNCYGTMDIAKNVILKALEAQPSEDCISRQAAIDALWKALYEYEDKTENQFLKSKELDVADWFQHRIFVQNMSDIDRQTILSLPSVAPQPKTEERTEMHECDLEQIIKTAIKEYLDKDCDDVTELLLALSKDLCERIRKESENGL